MKMTPDWLAETAAHLESWGFTRTVDTSTRTLHDRPVYQRTRYSLARGLDESLVLDALAYADGSVSYWLEIVDWHGLQSHPYRLDSWRHRPGQVEFKYHVDPETGTGLALVIRSPSPS